MNNNNNNNYEGDLIGPFPDWVGGPKTIVKTLSYLEGTGFEITPMNDLPFNCKCLTIAISRDLPAKSMVYNTKQDLSHFEDPKKLEKH